MPVTVLLEKPEFSPFSCDWLNESVSSSKCTWSFKSVCASLKAAWF